jgi:hypothetical protein
VIHAVAWRPPRPGRHGRGLEAPRPNRSAEVLEAGVLINETRRPVPGTTTRLRRGVELKIDAELIDCDLPL